MRHFNARVIIVTEGWILDIHNNEARWFLITFCTGLDGDNPYWGVKCETPKIHSSVAMMTGALKWSSIAYGIVEYRYLLHPAF